MHTTFACTIGEIQCLVGAGKLELYWLGSAMVALAIAEALWLPPARQGRQAPLMSSAQGAIALVPTAGSPYVVQRTETFLEEL
jgi:hypothetical protein